MERLRSAARLPPLARAFGDARAEAVRKPGGRCCGCESGRHLEPIPESDVQSSGGRRSRLNDSTGHLASRPQPANRSEWRLCIVAGWAIAHIVRRQPPPRPRIGPRLCSSCQCLRRGHELSGNGRSTSAMAPPHGVEGISPSLAGVYEVKVRCVVKYGPHDTPSAVYLRLLAAISRAEAGGS